VSDSRLRDLERRWKETGAAEDEAAFLLERLRVGDLTAERLELAAHCGHPAGQLALGRPVQPRGPVREWATRFAELAGRSGAVRCLIALAHDLRQRLGRQRLEEDRAILFRGFGETLDAVETWVIDPNTRTRGKVTKTHARARPPASILARSSADVLLNLLGHSLQRAVQAVTTGVDADLVMLVSSGVGSALSGERAGIEDGAVWTAICDEVAPWALGLGDPVSDRQRTPRTPRDDDGNSPARS
jgi:hypothetical protein